MMVKSRNDESNDSMMFHLQSLSHCKTRFKSILTCGKQNDFPRFEFPENSILSREAILSPAAEYGQFPIVPKISGTGGSRYSSALHLLCLFCYSAYFQWGIWDSVRPSVRAFVIFFRYGQLKGRQRSHCLIFWYSSIFVLVAFFYTFAAINASYIVLGLFHLIKI